MDVGYVISYSLVSSGYPADTGYISGVLESVAVSNYKELIDNVIANISNPESHLVQINSVQFLNII